MIPFRKTLAFRILGISFILLALPLFVDSFVVVQRSYRDAVADAKQRLVRLAHERALPFSLLQPVKRAFLLLLEHKFGLSHNFPREPSKEVGEKLRKITEGTPISGVYLSKITPEGRIRVVDGSDPHFIGHDYTAFFSSIDLYSPAVYERGYRNVISYDEKTKQPYYIVSRVVYSAKEDRPVGIISAATEVTSTLDRLLRVDRGDYPVYFALLESDKVVYAATDPTLLFQYFAPIDKKRKETIAKIEPLAGKLMSEKAIKIDESIGYPFFEFEWVGEEQIGYLTLIEGSDLFLLTYASRQAILAAPLRAFYHIYGTYGLILLVGTLVAYLLARFLGRPFRQLCQVMHAIDQGDLGKRYREDRVGYEINTLGMAFNGMLDTLITNRQRAEKERLGRELYEKELRIGQSVQRSLLPEKMPHYHGVELREIFIPAREVGGDFYDVYTKDLQESEELVLTIADASGKGVFACFYSLDVRAIFRAFTQKERDVAKIMAKTNHLFCADTGDSGMFVTAAMGMYSHSTHTLRYYSCGHNPPLLRRASGQIEMLDHLGVALGLDPDIPFGEEKKTVLGRGDLVVFYTDGVTEAQDVKGSMFTEKRLEEFLRDNGELPLPALVEALTEEIERFAKGAPQHDDITVLVMRVVQ